MQGLSIIKLILNYQLKVKRDIVGLQKEKYKYKSRNSQRNSWMVKDWEKQFSFWIKVRFIFYLMIIIIE